MMNKAKRFDEAAFLVRLKQGDERAWSQLSEIYGNLLYKYLRSRLPTAEATEDVLMETMATAVRTIGTFDEKTSLPTYLYTLANHKVIDFYLRNTKIDELPPEVNRENSASISPEFSEFLTHLSAMDRQLLLLRYQQGLGIDEIAMRIGRSYKATETLLSRARSQLQKAMKEDRSTETPAPHYATPEPILKSAVQMLAEQEQNCRALDMSQAAQIFARAAELLENLIDEASILSPKDPEPIDP